MAQWAVRKPPSVILLYDLVSQGQLLTQVDDDLLETLGTMAKRASQWEASVRDAFRGPAEKVEGLIDVDTLRKLLDQAKHIPVLLPLEPKVVAALDDGGNRYCLCRGPNDGTFMVECDDCDQWFHGSCVNLKVRHNIYMIARGASCQFTRPAKNTESPFELGEAEDLTRKYLKPEILAVRSKIS